MSNSVQIPLKPGWVEETDPSPNNVRTFFRNPTRCGPLQLSWWSASEYGGIGDTSLLPGIAATFGEDQFGCGEAKRVSGGTCAFGSYGTAFFSAPPDQCHAEIWVLFNGDGFLLVTYTAAQFPDPSEIAEVRDTVLQIVRPSQAFET